MGPHLGFAIAKYKGITTMVMAEAFQEASLGVTVISRNWV